jgi:hypothetical protein
VERGAGIRESYRELEQERCKEWKRNRKWCGNTLRRGRRVGRGTGTLEVKEGE